MRIGLFASSVKGLVILAAIVPSILTVIIGLVEALPIAWIVALACVTLMCGAAFMLIVTVLAERALRYFTSRKDQRRVASQLSPLIDEGVTVIDAPTAAAIWAGTREEGDVVRHICFRRIKNAVNKGEIANPTNLSPKGVAFVETKFPMVELVKFLRARGAIGDSDVDISNS